MNDDERVQSIASFAIPELAGQTDLRFAGERKTGGEIASVSSNAAYDIRLHLNRKTCPELQR